MTLEGGSTVISSPTAGVGVTSIGVDATEVRLPAAGRLKRVTVADRVIERLMKDATPLTRSADVSPPRLAPWGCCPAHRDGSRGRFPGFRTGLRESSAAPKGKL